jgi:carboxypeptidase PM20D1
VATDSRYFANLTGNTFRFLPLRVTATDLKRMHGANERISVRNYENAIRTYRQMLMDLAGN